MLSIPILEHYLIGFSHICVNLNQIYEECTVHLQNRLVQTLDLGHTVVKFGPIYLMQKRLLVADKML